MVSVQLSDSGLVFSSLNGQEEMNGDLGLQSTGERNNFNSCTVVLLLHFPVHFVQEEKVTVAWYYVGFNMKEEEK